HSFPTRRSSDLSQLNGGKKMQQLFFEAAWDHTISDQDRYHITELFEAKDHEKGKGLESTYINHATNHRGDLLYTVLLHNYQDVAYAFVDENASLQDGADNIITEKFTIPENIPPRMSMQWTFIFPSSMADNINISEASFLLKNFNIW